MPNLRTYDGDLSLTCESSFTPNLTTKLAFQSAKEVLSERFLRNGVSILELGCGCGVIGISLAEYLSAQGIRGKFYMSDLSCNAVEEARNNLRSSELENEHEFTVRQGSLFSPWHGVKADLIVSDVSGISEELARVSGWFDNAPCGAGADGLGLLKQVLAQYSVYLYDGGRIIFPYLSLSSFNGFAELISVKQIKARIIDKIRWPLPATLVKEHSELLLRLNLNGFVSLTYNRGLYIAETSIYEAV